MSLRRRMEDDIERDIRDHIDMETRENIERGMTPSDARAAALRKFGNPLRIAEDTRAVWRWGWVERLLQDTRYALRGLRRNPVFAAIVILTLALGIGLNTAVFSVVNAVLIEPLHYPHPERLLWLAEYNKAFKVELVRGPDFLDWRAQAQSFDKMFAYGYDDKTIAYGNTTDRPLVAEVTGDFWPITAIKPAAGRLFTDADQDVIVLSHSLFQRRFAADPGVIGKTVMVDGHPTTVVGVLPQGFRFLFPTPSRDSEYRSDRDRGLRPQPIIRPRLRSGPHQHHSQRGGALETRCLATTGPQRDGRHPRAHRQTISKPNQLRPGGASGGSRAGKAGGQRTPGFAPHAGRRDFRAPDRVRQYRRASCWRELPLAAARWRFARRSALDASA